MKNIKLLDNPVDPFTFGSSPAAVFLSDLLTKSNDKHLLTKVSKKISHYFKILNEINKMQNQEVQRSILDMVRTNLKNDLVINKFPTRIKSCTFNVIMSKYKNCLRKSNAQLEHSGSATTYTAMQAPIEQMSSFRVPSGQWYW